MLKLIRAGRKMRLKTIKARITDFLKPQETSRGALILGSVLTIALSFILSFCSSLYLQNKSRVDNQRADQIKSLTDSTLQSQVFLWAFASEILDTKKVRQETRKNLLENLQSQYARLSILRDSVPPEAFSSIDSYREKVGNMIEVINTIDTTLTPRFWEAASDLLVARKQLHSYLQSVI